MKRGYVWWLLLLSLCLLLGCGQTESVPTATETESATVTETETETVTVTETVSLTEEERLQRISDATPFTEVPVTAWGLTSNSDLFATYLQLLLDAGINTCLAVEPSYSMNGIFAITEAAEETGAKLYFFTYGMSAKAIDNHWRLVYDSPAIRGLYLYDEPLYEQNLEIGKVREDLKQYLPTDNTWSIGANLFPSVIFADRTEGYTYAVHYLDAVQPDYLAWDYYPFSKRNTLNDGMGNFICNLLQMQSACMGRDVSLFTYLQACNLGKEAPSERQFLCEMHTALALGSKELFLFQLDESVITDDCVVQEQYGVLASALTRLPNMKGVFLGYDFEYAVVRNHAGTFEAASEYGVEDLLFDAADGWSTLLCSDTDASLLVGCFRDGEGNPAYYFVNLNYLPSAESITVTLTLTEADTYQIWGTDSGLSAAGDGDAVTFSLQPGDGKFIRIHTENTISER